jgi:hypothetical protein
MKIATMKIYGILTLSASCIATLSTGCVERRVVYFPAYQTQPGYVYQAPPASTPTTAQTSPSPGQTAPPPDASSGQVVVAQAPPAPQAEVVPMAPGPEYVWMPGFWSIGVGGGWVWVRGHYGIRPRPHAVWVTGHWARHRHGYVWIGGSWR